MLFEKKKSLQTYFNFIFLLFKIKKVTSSPDERVLQGFK